MERSELFAFLAIALGIAAFFDLRSRRIPNWLNLSIIVASVTFYIVTSGFEGLLFSVEGMFVGLGIMLVPYLMGGMGAGDAKLMAAVGSILGPKGVIVAILYTVIIGGIYDIILLLWHGL
jgi:prepilin peptidase CpaA